jgi:HAD superfamily hydrolase (TIGR01509 family)
MKICQRPFLFVKNVFKKSRMLNNIKVILLDLGGVTFQSTGVSNEVIDWKIISQLNNIYGHDLNVGKDRFPEFMKDYNRLTGQSLSGAAFLEGVFDTLVFNADLVQLLSQIGDIIIVSDNYRENIEYISERYHFSDWAVHQIYSFDYQLEKADPLFFEKLLQELDYESDELLFIDDSPRKIESAQKHGIKGIVFHNNEQLKVDLGL